MIKFFRKIRQNLLLENKTSKYFKYAIGEILLVMIGILIALQVNNLNEKRKIGGEMTDKIKALAVNLEDEITVSGIFYHPQKIASIQKVLDGELPIDSLRANPDYINPNNLKDDVLEETIDILIENEDRLPLRYSELIGKMKSLKFYFSVYKTYLIELNELKRNNEMILENNYAWYSLNDSISNNKRWRYFTQDSLFRNRLFTIQSKYRQALNFYSTTIVRKLEILCAIKKVDENYTAEDYRRYLSSSVFSNNPINSFVEAKKVACDIQPDSLRKVASAHILINTSLDTLVYSKRRITMFIAPKTSAHVFNSETDNIIKLYRNNQCEAYQVTTNNFIIIE